MFFDGKLQEAENEETTGLYFLLQKVVGAGPETPFYYHKIRISQVKRFSKQSLTDKHIR